MKKKDRTKNIVVGILFVGALASVTWSIGGKRFSRRVAPVRQVAQTVPDLPAAPPAATSPATTSTSGTPQAAAPPGTPLEPEKPIELAIVLSQYPAWIDHPQRDPFQTFVAPAPKVEGPRAADVLAVHGIWRQSGGHYTVLNDRILTEGEMIASFRVEKIDATTVWVRGTNGMERLDFQVGAPPPPPPAPNNQPGRRIAGAGTTRERRLSP